MKISRNIILSLILLAVPLACGMAKSDGDKVIPPNNISESNITSIELENFFDGVMQNQMDIYYIPGGAVSVVKE